MTTEQIAIVAPTTAAVLIAGINAWWQARVNRQTLEANRRLAVQERIRTTYEDMLNMVAWAMEIVDSRDMGAEREDPPGPGTERRRAVEARIGVHGSQEVKAVLEQWAQEHKQFTAAFDDFHLAEGLSDDEMLALWKKVADARSKLHRIVRELEDAVSDEMRA